MFPYTLPHVSMHPPVCLHVPFSMLPSAAFHPVIGESGTGRQFFYNTEQMFLNRE